ncbi:MAG: hypothetical protein AAB383_04840 [Patescibacteria group bacterium]
MAEKASTLVELIQAENLRPVSISSSSALKPGDKVLWIPDASDLTRDMAEISDRVRILIVKESEMNGLPCVEIPEEKRTVQLSLLKSTDRVFYLSTCRDSSAPAGWVYRKEEPVQRSMVSSSSSGGSDLDLLTALRGGSQRLPHDTVSHLKSVLGSYPLGAKKGNGYVMIESSVDFYNLMYTQLKICNFSLTQEPNERYSIEDSRLGQIADILGDELIKKGYRATPPLKDKTVAFHKGALFKDGRLSGLILYHQ